MAKCAVCGGAFKCPAGRFLAVRAPQEGEVLELPKDQDPGDEWAETHILGFPPVGEVLRAWASPPSKRGASPRKMAKGGQKWSSRR
jgi:hypothetical protein